MQSQNSNPRSHSVTFHLDVPLVDMGSHPAPAGCKSLVSPSAGSTTPKAPHQPRGDWLGPPLSPLCESSGLLAPAPSQPSLQVQPKLHSGGDTPPPQTRPKEASSPRIFTATDTPQGQHLASRSSSSVSRTQAPSRHRRWVRVPAPGWSPPLVSLCSLVGLGLPRDFLVDAEWSGDPARSASGSGRRDPPPAEPADPRPSRRRGLPRSVLNPLGAKARTSVGSGQGEQRL